MTPQDGAPRWEPVPVPQGDGRHDIGDDVRAAIVQRLMSDWSHDPDLTPAKVRQLAMWAGASVRALLHEIGTLRDMTAAPPASLAPGAPRYRIGSDNSGHRYFYLVDREAEFSAWQELDEDDERSWTEPSFATRIDGRFTFTDPRCE
jgi:hypothetical protein